MKPGIDRSLRGVQTAVVLALDLAGEAGASTGDVRRTVLEARPDLRRVYAAITELHELGLIETVPGSSPPRLRLSQVLTRSRAAEGAPT